MAPLIDAKRQKLVDGAHLLVANKKLIYYRQVRPFPVVSAAALDAAIDAHHVLDKWDCSASIIELYHLAGAQDPSGYQFQGYGNTGSFLKHLPHYIDPRRAHAGAILVLNGDQDMSIQHAVMVVAPGADPVCFTHGGHSDPSFYHLSWLQPGFHGKTVCLDVGQLG